MKKAFKDYIESIRLPFSADVQDEIVDTAAELLDEYEQSTEPLMFAATPATDENNEAQEILDESVSDRQDADDSEDDEEENIVGGPSN